MNPKTRIVSLPASILYLIIQTIVIIKQGCTKLANDFNRKILAEKMLTIIKETYKQRQKNL